MPISRYELLVWICVILYLICQRYQFDIETSPNPQYLLFIESLFLAKQNHQWNLLIIWLDNCSIKIVFCAYSRSQHYFQKNEMPQNSIFAKERLVTHNISNKKWVHLVPQKSIENITIFIQSKLTINHCKGK